jgi:hypothetical protein
VARRISEEAAVGETLYLLVVRRGRPPVGGDENLQIATSKTEARVA